MSLIGAFTMSNHADITQRHTEAGFRSAGTATSRAAAYWYVTVGGVQPCGRSGFVMNLANPSDSRLCGPARSGGQPGI